MEIQIKYEGYIDRESDQVRRMVRLEKYRIPMDLEYASLHGLSSEVVQKLEQVRPRTLGQAARIPGITPAAVSVLSIHLGRLSRSSREA